MSCGRDPADPSVCALAPASSSDPLMVIANAELGADTLPARSVTTEVTDHLPSLNAGKSQLVTVADATYVHDTVVPSDLRADTVTEVPAGNTPPEIVGVVSDVRLSVAEAPVSDESDKSGTPEDGAVASIEIDNAALAGDTLPAGSVTVEAMDHAPSLSTGKSQLDTVADAT